MINRTKYLTFLIIFIFSSTLRTQEIHDATKAGNLEKVRALIEGNPSLLTAKDGKGFTPLHSAVSKGRQNVVTYLIEKGANLEIKTKNGHTPLFMALDLSRNNVAKILIDHGANINIRGYLNRTLLHMAARSGNISIVKHLLSKGMDINSLDSNGATALDITIESGKADMAKYLKENGGIFNLFDIENVNYRNLLNRAIYNGQTELVKVMIDLGRLPTDKDQIGRMPLHWAAARDQLEIAQFLLDKGADVNSKNAEGKTPIFFAAKYGHQNMSELLQSNGASVVIDIEKNFGFSPDLNKILKNREAFIWYLGHSGWAVKTKNRLMIFDYTERTNRPSNPSLANGYINSTEIQNQNTFVFVSHSHDDHFDRSIFRWKNSNSSTQYILGFKPEREPSVPYMLIKPRESKEISGMKIHTIKSTDLGVGFLLEVDGLKIYHAGDHANKQNVKYGDYHKEIDYLANIVPDIDIAFILSGAACGGGYETCVIEGDFYAIDKLSPNVVFPMHSEGNEHIYQKFKTDALKINSDQQIIPAQFKGDRFFYTRKK